MILPALFFYLFAGICVASAVMVIVSRNPVHSVLFLVLACVNAAGLFVLLGAEFLAMILVVVYVGAVAVLFLFVVMMLDINFAELRSGVLEYLPIGGSIGPWFCRVAGELGGGARRRPHDRGPSAAGQRRLQHGGARAADLHRLHAALPGGRV